MQTKSESQALAPALEEVATALRLTGRITFWMQLALTLGCGIPLLLAITGSNFSKGTSPTLGLGMFWAACGIGLLCFSAYLAFRYGRIGKGLRNPDSKLRPKKADTIQLLRMGVMVGLVGILLNLLGAGATLTVLVAKSVSQPPGVTITDSNNIIRALDVFVELANVTGIAAHFVGTVAALWLLDKVRRH